MMISAEGDAGTCLALSASNSACIIGLDGVRAALLLPDMAQLLEAYTSRSPICVSNERLAFPVHDTNNHRRRGLWATLSHNIEHEDVRRTLLHPPSTVTMLWKVVTTAFTYGVDCFLEQFTCDQQVLPVG